MGTVWECIHGVVDLNKSYAMKMRLVRMYEALSFRKRDVQSIECVFHDEKEDRIQVTIPKSVMLNFRDILEEGQVFGLKNFKLLLNSGKYRVTTSKFKILVYDLTQIRPIFVAGFPNKRFWFESFNFVHQLDEDTVDDVALLDVMGALVDMGNLQQKTTASGTEKKILDIVLQDNEDRLLQCTLWDEFAQQADALLRSQTVNPIIVVLQLCKPNVYREQRRVNNVLHATKLVLHPDVEEVLDFTDRYVAKFGKKSSFSGGLSQGGSPSFEQDYVEGVSVQKTIIQLFDDDCQNMYCWIHAVIQSVDFRNGWYYISCPKCKRKVDGVGGRFSCLKCGVDDVSAVFRYKIRVRVSDDTGIATLLLWERECSELVGKSAAELAQISGSPSAGGCQHRIEDALLHKKVSFRIQLTSDQSAAFSGSYNVTKVSLLAPLVPTFTDSQESSYNPMHTDSSLMGAPITRLADPISPHNSVDLHNAVDKGADNLKTATPMSTMQSTSATVLLDDDIQCQTLDDSGVKRCLAKAFAEETTVKKKRKYVKKDRD